MRAIVERWRFALCSALLQCLDANRREIPGANASGFVRRESDGIYLYTCWHVVTGFDPYCKQSPQVPPTSRHYIRVTIQGFELRAIGGGTVGGAQTFDLQLLNRESNRLQPTWHQDQEDIPHVEINALGLRVPYWHDAVRLRIPSDVPLSDLQIIGERPIFGLDGEFLNVGDKVFVVGYPYGFSAGGPEQPIPVTLTRFVAGTVPGRRRQFLLESIGAAGMSGGPVFVDFEGNPLLIGLYTGLIFPDHLRANPERATALGTVADITAALRGQSPFVRPQPPDQMQ